jgi:hypothetical protein
LKIKEEETIYLTALRKKGQTYSIVKNADSKSRFKILAGKKIIAFALFCTG